MRSQRLFSRRSPGAPALRRVATLLGVGALALTGTLGTLPAASADTPNPIQEINPDTANPSLKSVNPKDYHEGRYIVVMTGQPTVAYGGGVAGLAPTKPLQGKKFDAEQSAALKYDSYLRDAQQKAAAPLGVTVEQNFTTALNGFVATLDTTQAVALAAKPDVLMVVPDTQNSPTESSVDFLGMRGKTGVWQTQFGSQAAAGAGTVVGVIDTGYWPESPYFEGSKAKRLAAGAKPQVGVPYLKSPGVIAMLKADGSTFEGACEVGQDFDGSACNTKVISARYFDDAFTASVPESDRAPQEVLSPVDIDSHGTHTASTAAGNNVKNAVVNGRDYGPSAGVAPGAKLAIYKVCWEDTDPDTGGCYSSSSIDAINQAIIDGVDVLNYSISGSTSVTTDPVSLAFLSAVSAGVFVSASAGNSGPTASTVVHGAPWMTSVAATTWTNQVMGTVALSDGTKLRGVSQISTAVPQTSLILAQDAAAAGATAADAALCKLGTIDPAKAKGKILVCDRGVNDRVEKSKVALEAGAVGMVLVNVTVGSLDSDLHSVPTVHIDVAEGVTLKQHMAANAALTAAIEVGDTTGLPPLPLPQVADFSSRGPLVATTGDLLKPDIAAPGVNVLAGVSPVGADGNLFGMLSGTSMASPHIAGFGALLLSKNPTWTPSMVKSAMTTTAQPAKNADGSAETTPFNVGAGQIAPASIFAPGLTVQMSNQDYLNFLAGQGLDVGISGTTPTIARDANVPSLALGSLTGTVTVKRTFTALEAGVYQAKANVPGVNIKVTPSILSFNAPGEQRTVTYTITNGSAPLGKYAFGDLTVEGKGKVVRLPVAIQPIAVQAPFSLALGAQPATGSTTFPVTSGTDGDKAATLTGLAKSTTVSANNAPTGFEAAEGAPSVRSYTMTVPEGASYARFIVTASDKTDDWDMQVKAPSGAVYTAATPSADEAVILTQPAPGVYTVTVQLYSTADNAASTAQVGYAALTTDLGNADLTPNPLQTANGETSDMTLSWFKLPAGEYLGLVRFDGSPYDTLVTLSVAGKPVKGKPAAPAAPGQLPSDGTQVEPVYGQDEIVEAAPVSGKLQLAIPKEDIGGTTPLPEK
ncbi:S8 family serine peptidase [Micrococcales bacterium 31B]|nr:S8 family serine peptidase [Micrococcales bacterium 31B]